MSEKKIKNYEKLQYSKCEICWKSFIWACPLLLNFPKNVVSCSAYEPTDVYLTEQKLILEFQKIWTKIVKQFSKKFGDGTCGISYLETLFEREFEKMGKRIR